MHKIIKWLYKYRFLIVLFLAFASRLIFFSSYKDFFDSMQYVWRSDAWCLLSALTNGHAPFHPGYIFFTYYSNQILHLFNIYNTVLAANIPSTVFGSLSILIFYALAEKVFNTKTAILATLLAAITPYFWISNMAIIVDPTMIVFYLLSLYLYCLWLKDEKHHWYYLILSGFAFGYSMWTHTQIALWIFGFAGLFICYVKFKNWFAFIIKSIPWIIGPLCFILIYLYLLVFSGYCANYFEAAKYLFFGNAGDRISLNLSPGVRNYLIIMSVFLAILSVFGIIRIFYLERQKALFILIWLAPGLFLSALYLYANLYGRASMIALFPGMLAVSYLFTSWVPKQKIITVFKYFLILLAIGQLLFISIPIINLYAKTPTPYEEMDIARKKLEPGGLIILSNLEKTLVGYEGDNAVVWEMSKEIINEKIQKALNNNKPIFVDMDAIRFPYYQYDGHNWEIKSSNIADAKEHKSLLNYLFATYNFDLALTSALGNKVGAYNIYLQNKDFSQRLKDNINALSNGQTLVIGKVIDENSNQAVKELQINAYSADEPISREKINYNDWLYYLYNLWQKESRNEPLDPLNWTYTDKDGYFILTIPSIEISNSINFTATSDNVPVAQAVNNSDNQTVDFIVPETQTLAVDAQNEGTINIKSLNQLLDKVKELTSFYLLISKNNDTLHYHLISTNYHFNTSNIIKAEYLSHGIGQMNKEGIYATKSEKGFLSYGPWIDLSAGKYQITFRLKTLKNTTDSQIGTVEISSKNNSTPIAQKILLTDDFITPDQYQDFTLEFDTGDVKEVEFRTASLGVADLAIESIRINKK